MKKLLTVITITILLPQTQTQGCETYPPRVYCSDVTFEKGKPLQTGQATSGIEEIFLDGKSIPAIPSGIFNNFTNVTLIFLQLGAFTIEPGAFNGVTNLKTLSLRHNKFTQIPNGALTKLTQLELLDLSYNKLTEIKPGSLNLPTSLKILYLTRNHLRVIKPGSLDSLVNLRDLHLNFNIISKIQPGTLNKLTSMTRLNLEHNVITQLDRYGFQNLSNLEYLQLGNSFLKHAVIEEGAFQDLSQLVHLDLQYNHLTKLEPELFQNLHNLEHLLLNNNQLNLIPKKILEPLTKLKVLIINNNNITSLDAESLLNSLPKLEVISLDNNILQCESLPKNFELFENRDVTIIENYTETFPNVYGVSCVCNNKAPSLNLNTRIPIRGCKTVNDRSETDIQIDTTGIFGNTTKKPQKMNPSTEEKVTTTITNPGRLENVGATKAIATETAAKPERVNPSTEETVDKTQNVDHHLEKFENHQENLSTLQDTVNVSTIVISVIACIVFITLIAFCIHRRKKLNIPRNFSIKYRDVNFLSDDTET